jgi:hypothetical protein
MHTSQVSIGDRTFNVAQAPADKQVKLINLISFPIINAKESFKESDYTIKLLSWMLMGSPNELVRQIDDIVLYKTFEDGQKIKVDVKFFQGKPTDYFDLLAKAILENVGDFFERLRDENKSDLVSPNPIQT